MFAAAVCGRRLTSSVHFRIQQRHQRQIAALSQLLDNNHHYDSKSTTAANLMMALASVTAVAGSIAIFQDNSSKHTQLEAATDIVLDDDDDEETTDVINWSGTHKVTVANKHYHEPESVQEVEAIVRHCHESGQTVRPIGSSLSPNGIALNQEGMISMANVDRVLEVDTTNNTITVEAGIPVSKVVEALRPYNLTLPNLASIAEQQMGGFIQVGAHGTGKKVSPVDHYVTKIKLVTPNQGTVELTKATHGRLFELARVGLGCLGVVVEITMECIPAHKLVEHTFVLTRDQAIQQKDALLEKHKHMRFMWIPYTDAVVVVTNDPSDDVPDDVPRNQTAPSSQEERNSPLTQLLKELCEEHNKPFVEEDVKGMGFGEIRDALLAFDPLSVKHVKRCNRAEADFWKKNEGYQTKPSDELLQFDCGGQQWNSKFALLRELNPKTTRMIPNS